MSTETVGRLESTLQLCEAILEASQVLSLSRKELQALMRTLCVMAREDTVQAEHIRGPLTECIPGALQVAAKAMGMRTPIFVQSLDAGSVQTEEFFHKFATELRKVTERIALLILNSEARERR